MQITVVTTTLNALPYIIETTRSVLQSSYPDLEYILIDAGSTDGTVDYLRTISDSRARLEVIKGIRQYEALDWGFRHSTGDVLAWLNGDDLYYPGTISCVAELFSEFPEVKWLTGLPSFVDADGHSTMLAVDSSYPRRFIENGWFTEFAFGNLIQESMFWRRDLYEEVCGLNLDFDLAADFELWTRFARQTPLVAVRTLLASFRKHETNRSVMRASAYLSEVERVRATLPQMNWIRNLLCGRTATRHILRLAEWHRSPWIYFSATQSRWMKTTMFRPVSRYSFAQLLQEFRANANEPDLPRTNYMFRRAAR